MPSYFFSNSILRSEALGYNSFFQNSDFKEIFRQKILTHCNFSCGSLLVKVASKTMIRSIHVPFIKFNYKDCTERK